MKKILPYILLCMFVFFNVFASCKEKNKKNRIYLTKHEVYDNVDSIKTNLTIYTGEVNGHKIIYHIFNGKFKSQMEIWHLKDECKKCINSNVNNDKK